MSFPSFNTGDVLTAADMNAVGAYLLQTKTLTASASPIQFNNVFTEDYDTYFLTAHLQQNTSTASYNMQLQDAANAAITGPDYDASVGGSYVSSGSTQFAGFNQVTGQTSVFVGGAVAGDSSAFCVYFQRPRAAVKTYGAQWLQSDNYTATLTNLFLQGGYVHTLAVAYYGCRINITAGTVTGKASLYGLKS